MNILSGGILKINKSKLWFNCRILIFGSVFIAGIIFTERKVQADRNANYITEGTERMLSSLTTIERIYDDYKRYSRLSEVDSTLKSSHLDDTSLIYRMLNDKFNVAKTELGTEKDNLLLKLRKSYLIHKQDISSSSKKMLDSIEYPRKDSLTDSTFCDQKSYQEHFKLLSKVYTNTRLDTTLTHEEKLEWLVTNYCINVGSLELKDYINYNVFDIQNEAKIHIKDYCIENSDPSLGLQTWDIVFTWLPTVLAFLSIITWLPKEGVEKEVSSSKK